MVLNGKNSSASFSAFINKLQNRHYLLAWLVYHGLAVLLLVFRLLWTNTPLYFDADIMNMIPAPTQDPALSVINDSFANVAVTTARVFFCHEDFDKARELAEVAYGLLKDEPEFDEVSLYTDSSYVDEVLDYVHRYRWNLIDEKTADEILAPGGAEAFAENALSQAYGAFTLTGLNFLDDDPFLLTDHAAGRLLKEYSSTAIQLPSHEGVTAAQFEGKWYVAIFCSLKEDYAGIGEKSGAKTIYDKCRPLEGGEVRLLYFGTPFTTYANAMQATKEITLITSISLLIVVAILLMVFRSPVPVLASVLSIGVSMGVALCTTLAVFGNVHIFALLLGTSLIGSCLDYSLHFFMNWKANRKISSSKDVRRAILRGLSLSLGTTVLCYGVLAIIPYTLLKQMAVFSIAGLLSTFLTTLGIYPFLPFPKEASRNIRVPRFFTFSENYDKKKVGRVAMTVVFVSLTLLAGLFHKNIRIYNDLPKLYEEKGRVRADKREIKNLLSHAQVATTYCWFVVKGESEDAVFEAEKRLAEKCLECYRENGIVFSNLGVSKFIPTVAAQKKSREAAEKLLALAEFQYEALGYEDGYAEELRRSFEESEKRYFSVRDPAMPAFLKDSFSLLWQGEYGGSYYTIFVPSAMMDEDVYRSLAEDDEQVYYVDREYEISRDLDTVTSMILLFFVFSYVAMFVALKFFYTVKHTLKIVSIPILVLLVVVVVYAVMGCPLEFFTIAGMILVLGLGLDYVIYMLENEKRFKGTEDAVLEPFAIFLSFFTTVISFGALALSTFLPVHYIGFTIFLGLVTAYFSSVLYDRS